MPIAEPQPLRCRNRRPAAAGDDLLVARDRRFRRLRGRWVESRQRRIRHQDVARSGIEALSEIAAARLLHEQVEHGVLGRRSARKRKTDARGDHAPHERPPACLAVTPLRPSLHRNPCPRTARAVLFCMDAGRPRPRRDASIMPHRRCTDRRCRCRAVAAIDYGRRWAILCQKAQPDLHRGADAKRGPIVSGRALDRSAGPLREVRAGKGSGRSRTARAAAAPC